MIVYHGSVAEIQHPDVLHSRASLDFGKGFYLTTIKYQAEKWAKRTSLRHKSTPVVNVYEMDEDWDEFNALTFSDDGDWVEFVCNCRRGNQEYKMYDVIMGGVANDDVYNAVGMYFRGIWDIKRTLQELKFYKINDQICLTNQNVINKLLRFKYSYEVKND